LSRGKETKSAVCESADYQGASEPEMNVGEPAAGFGFVFEVAVVMVPAEEDLNVCCCEDSRAEEVV
jgi:hypothetical protein